MEIEKVKELFREHFNEIEWERYDFVDPPYVWNVSGWMEVDGYSFDVDGDEIVNEGYEAREVICMCPDGEVIIF